MKKVIISLILGLLFPMVALADMGAPMITEYKVRVKNPEGLVTENEKGQEVTIPYDTVLTIMYEYEFEDGFFGEAYYNNAYFYIDLEETELVNEDINLNKFTKDKNKVLVVGNGAELYKGPSKMYGKINGAVIPKGTELTYEYHDEVWAYVDYNGLKGWIYAYPYDDYGSLYGKDVIKSIAEEYQGTLYTMEDTKIYDDPIQAENVIMTIPQGESIKYTYMYNHEYLYVTYEGKSGWYKLGNYMAEEYKNQIFTVNPSHIYANPSFEADVLKTIPAFKELTYTRIYYPIYFYGDSEINYWYYIDYEGTKGWVTKEFDDDYNVTNDLIDTEYYLGEVTQDGFLKADFQGEDSDQEVLKGTKVNVKYTYYLEGSSNNLYYIETDNYQGWYEGRINFIENSQTEFTKPLISNSKEKEETPKPEEPKEEPNTPPKEEKEKPKTSIRTIALYGVGASIIIALVTFVTIKLVNKKKTMAK